jgi:hypothetical protein
MVQRYNELLALEGGSCVNWETGQLKNTEGLARLEENLHGCRLIKPAWTQFRSFCIYGQNAPDAMHLADLGVFPAILTAIFSRIKGDLFDPFPDGKARWGARMELLEHRLANETLLDQDGVPEYACSIVEKLLKAKENKNTHPVLKAWEFRRVSQVSFKFLFKPDSPPTVDQHSMIVSPNCRNARNCHWLSLTRVTLMMFHQALPLALPGLVQPDLEFVAKETGATHPDPVMPACTVIVLYVEWYASTR